MAEIVTRLREPILADAFEQRIITSGQLAERLIRERAEAADKIERLLAIVRSCRAAMAVSQEIGGGTDWTHMIADLDKVL